MPVINLTQNGNTRHAADPVKSHSLMYSVALFPFSVCCFLSEFDGPFLSLSFPSQSVISFSQFVVTLLNLLGPFLNLLLSSSVSFFLFSILFHLSICCSLSSVSSFLRKLVSFLSTLFLSLVSGPFPPLSLHSTISVIPLLHYR